MSEVQFVRFQCDAGHISAFRFGTEDVSLEYCPVCGDTGVTQLDSQYVEADIMGDTGPNSPLGVQ